MHATGLSKCIDICAAFMYSITLLFIRICKFYSHLHGFPSLTTPLMSIFMSIDTYSLNSIKGIQIANEISHA